MSTTMQTNNGIPVDLPIRKVSVIAHVKNLDYCISELSKYHDSEWVLGYVSQKSIGTIEVNHRVLPKTRAEELKSERTFFKYYTLDTLLQRQAMIQEGNLKVDDNGLVLGFSEGYRRKMGWIK
jgi:hypothetical protein